MIREATKCGDSRGPNAQDKQWSDTAVRLCNHLGWKNSSIAIRNNEVSRMIRHHDAPPGLCGTVDPKKVIGTRCNRTSWPPSLPTVSVSHDLIDPNTSSEVTAEQLLNDVVRIRDDTSTFNTAPAQAITCGASFKPVHPLHVNFVSDVKNDFLTIRNGEIRTTARAENIPYPTLNRKRAAE